MTETTSLVISVIVPLVFSIGMILVFIFKRRIRCINTLIKIIIYIIHITAIVLVIVYLSISIIDYGQFFRKLFGLYFPIILITFGCILSVLDTVPILFLISAELTIIHTEIETTKIPFIIILCFFFLAFHSLIYVYSVDINNNSLQIEKSEYIFVFLLFVWVVIQIYSWILYGTMAEIKLKELLFLFVPFFIIFPFSLMFIASKMWEEFPVNIFAKFIISLHVIICNVLAYIKNDKNVSITTPIFTAYLLFAAQIIYIFSFKKCNPDLQYYERYKEDGDIYRINRKNKTAKLIIKGEENNYIKEHLMVDGIIFKIIGFRGSAWYNDKISKKIIIQNKLFVKKFSRISIVRTKFTTVVFDYELNYIELKIFLRNSRITKNLLVTDKCKGFVTNSNKLFSRGMDLCFCMKNSNHLLINESCRVIREKACECCINLKSIKFPDSLIKIGDLAFSDCKNLRNITFGKDSRLQTIGISAFERTDLRVLYFPKFLCFIRSKAFRSCKNLHRVVFPEISHMKILDLSSFNDNNISFEIPRPIDMRNCSPRSKISINLSQTNNFLIISLKTGVSTQIPGFYLNHNIL